MKLIPSFVCQNIAAGMLSHKASSSAWCHYPFRIGPFLSCFLSHDSALCDCTHTHMYSADTRTLQDGALAWHLFKHVSPSCKTAFPRSNAEIWPVSVTISVQCAMGTRRPWPSGTPASSARQTYRPIWREAPLQHFCRQHGVFEDGLDIIPCTWAARGMSCVFILRLFL